MRSHQAMLWDALVADYEVEGPGLTIDELSEKTGMTMQQIRDAIFALRNAFGESEDVNIVAIPPAKKGQWNYRLVGTMDGATSWTENRMRDALTRAKTIRNIVASVQRGEPDPRTALKAKIVHRSLVRMEEELRDAMELFDLAGMP